MERAQRATRALCAPFQAIYRFAVRRNTASTGYSCAAGCRYDAGIAPPGIASGQEPRMVPGMQPIRILLANHHPIVRSNLRSLLERESGLHVIAEAANGREAVILADYKHPDIILLDVKLPLLNGILAAREIAANNRKQGIVFVSVDTDEEYIQEAFKAGARGYVRSDSAQADLARAIRLVAGGGKFLSPGIELPLMEEAGN